MIGALAAWAVACAASPPPAAPAPVAPASGEETADVDDPVAQRAPGPAAADIPPALLAASAGARGLPFPARMAAVSKVFLGAPYVNDPMGEGRAPDPDPIARYDAFDCLTYAEEVLAWSFASDAAGAAEVRRSLRYGDGVPVDYAHRRHFMELQWIPGTIRDGWLRDTTAQYGRVETLSKEVTPATWKGWSSRPKFKMTDAELPVGPMKLDVLPLAEAQRVAASIRPGSLILTVRVDRPGVPLWTTHVSLLVPGDDGGTVLRHATKLGDVDQVRDHTLAGYLKHLETYSNWTVLGISVLEPVPQDVEP